MTEMNNYYGNHLRRVTKLVGYNYLLATLLNTHAAQLEKDKFLPTSNDKKVIHFFYFKVVIMS